MFFRRKLKTNHCRYPIPKHKTRILQLTPCYYFRTTILWSLATIGLMHSVFTWGSLLLAWLGNV